MRILGLQQTNVIMHFYFNDGSYVRGYVARAELDPISRSGTLLLVADNNKVITCDAGDVVKVSSRGPTGVMH